MNGVDSNGGVQVAVAPPPAHFVAASESTGVAADGDGGVVAEGDSGDDEDREELEREVDALMADKVYHDFVENVAKNKDIADEEDDGDFEVKENLGEAVGTAAAAAGDADDEDDDDASSEASTLTDPDEYEDAVEDVANVEVKIPKEALLEAEKRFPPFWRLKHALNNESMTEYKSDEDPDFDANEEEECPIEGGAAIATDEQAATNKDQMNAAAEWVGHRDGGAGGDNDNQDEELDSSTSSGDDDEDEDLDLDEASMNNEVNSLMDESSRPIQDDVVNGLVEMVEYMTLPPSDAAAAGAAVVVDDEEELMEEEEEQPAAAGQSILELDVEGYVSGEDPDFKPDSELLQRRASVSSSATSSSDEDENYQQLQEEEGTVEKME